MDHAIRRMLGEEPKTGTLGELRLSWRGFWKFKFWPSIAKGSREVYFYGDGRGGHHAPQHEADFPLSFSIPILDGVTDPAKALRIIYLEMSSGDLGDLKHSQ